MAHRAAAPKRWSAEPAQIGKVQREKALINPAALAKTSGVGERHVGVIIR